MKKSRRNQSKSLRRSSNRRMGIESLENRSLLAGDLLHNFVLPEDSDGNGSIDPLDALVVINRLNQDSGFNGSPSEGDPRLVDVDADNALTPLDALVVINHLNSRELNELRNMRASRVDMQRRIERIELAIANNTLPPNMTIENAESILETLRSGGRPELGDRMVDGLLHWKQDVIPAINERVDEQPNDSGAENAPSNAERFIEAISERLTAFGVTPEVIDTISSEIKAACESGAPMDMIQIRDRLAELGVDVDSILPQPGIPGRPGSPDQPGVPEQPDQPESPERPDYPERPDHPERPIMPAIMVTEPIAESIINRLRNAGVTLEVIETITREIWDAIEVGTPLDLQQVRARLEELGVDWENLHSPPRHPFVSRPELNIGDVVRQIVPMLGRIGINRDVILTIYNEARTAAANGTPMTFEQIVARLKELGVSLNGFNLAI